MPVLAEVPTPTPVWDTIISTIGSSISVSSVGGVLAAGATAAIALVFMWWGVRKVTQVIFSAFRKGKLRL